MDHRLKMINSQMPYVENYKIFGKIGCGSFSVVYKAVRKSTNQLSAIKYFKNQFEKKEKYFLVCKEIAMLRILKHPNIAVIHEYKIHHNLMYMIMEYFPNGNLCDYVNNRKNFIMEANVQRLVSQLASALVYMHSLRVFHGDLKFQNVVITSLDGPEIKLIDFGLSEVYIEDDTSSLKRGGSLFNMAPEVLLGFPFNYTSDIFSLGVLIYTIIYGYKPFKQLDRDMLFNAYKKRIPIQFPDEKLVLVTKNCLDLVKNLLSYDKQNRLSGQALLNHPFVKGKSYTDDRDHLVNSKESIQEAFKLANKTKNFSEAFVNCMQSILHLKIYLATNVHDNKDMREFFFKKIKEYEDLASRLQELVEQTRELSQLANQTDEYLKEICACSPHILNLVEMGLTGEMYLMENKREQALSCFKECVQGLIRYMEQEPNGQRRNLILKKMDSWVDYIAGLNNTT